MERLSTINKEKLAQLNRRPEDIEVLAVVIPKRKLSHIKFQIFLTNFMECADNAAFNHGPKLSMVLV
jgi:hypothetical protein